MQFITRALVGLPLIGLASFAVHAQQNGEISNEAAANMARNCFACHGPQGRSPGTIPSLHQHSADKIAALMKGFKSGDEPSTVMGRHAKGYSEAEIEAIARYIAGLNKR
jgi:sulfide dehydrogenase cytochrome subunit